MNHRILLADDEPQLLKVMKQYLTRVGYEVDACATGTEAWERFEERPEEYSLLVADATLRAAEGPALFERMGAVNPTMRFLICSGYPYDLNLLTQAVRERAAFLQKPFTPSMLASAIAELLGKTSGGAGGAA